LPGSEQCGKKRGGPAQGGQGSKVTDHRTNGMSNAEGSSLVNPSNIKKGAGHGKPKNGGKGVAAILQKKRKGRSRGPLWHSCFTVSNWSGKGAARLYTRKPFSKWDGTFTEGKNSLKRG